MNSRHPMLNLCFKDAAHEAKYGILALDVRDAKAVRIVSPPSATPSLRGYPYGAGVTLSAIANWGELQHSPQSARHRAV
jgi:hypothetical protein